MIGNQQEITKYLLDYKDGKIQMGKTTGMVKLDDVLRYKQGQFNIINGLDNVGKTVWILWYFLVLSNRHNLSWCIWSGENKAGMLVRTLIEYQTGKKLKELTEQEIMKNELHIQNWFTFIDNTKMYTNKELYKLFKESKCNGALIDPFTGMNRDYTHAANYNFLNETREFCNSTGITVYVNTHPVSEAARRTYPLEHPFEGYPMPPSKSQSEGGQPFANRPDDFITIHRLVGHNGTDKSPPMKYKTLIYIRKIKDTETGGEVTPIDDPIEFDFNRGLGFTLDNQNPLNNVVKDDLELSNLPFNNDFEEDTDNPF